MPNEEMGDRLLPQTPEVKASVIVLVVAGFLIFVAISMGVLFFYLRAEAPAAFKAPAERTFPQPALQKNPQNDLKQFEAEQRGQLAGFSWVDRDAGLAKIPIEAAMRMIAARGDRAYDPLDQPAAAPANAQGEPR